MFKFDRNEVSARPIAMGFVDLRAALIPCAVLTSFVAALVGLMLAIDAATRHLVI